MRTSFKVKIITLAVICFSMLFISSATSQAYFSLQAWAFSDYAGEVDSAIVSQMTDYVLAEVFTPNTAVASANGMGDAGIVVGGTQDASTEGYASLFNTDFVNPYPTPKYAKLNFMILGGEMEVLGTGVDMDYRILVTRIGIRPDEPEYDEFVTEGFLSWNDGIGRYEFSISGEDIGATFTQSPTEPQAEVYIPWSGNTYDIGIIQPGETFALHYSMRMRAERPNGGGWIEFFGGNLSDPYDLSLSPTGFLESNIVYTPVSPQPIPAPSAILLGSIGVGLVGWLRRRKTL